MLKREKTQEKGQRVPVDPRELLQREKESKRSGLHSLHRYFGKLIPAIPAFAIKAFTEEGDWVCDPFAGSGTTLVEAKRLNRNSLGLEINPIACFIARVKTTPLNSRILRELNRLLLQDIANDDADVLAEEKPFCPNREHWFKDFVQRDLVIISRNIDRFFERHRFPELGNRQKKEFEDFYRLVLSSVIRNVSNADPRHIFPGYSKRLRKLDQEGKRKINVRQIFRSSLIRKTGIMEEYGAAGNNCRAVVIQTDSRLINAEDYPRIKLIVTNPPYISSIRYTETMKLELYWMRHLLNREEYAALEKSIIGSDRLPVKEYKERIHVDYAEADELAAEIFRRDPKMGNVIARYFQQMGEVIENMNRLLEMHGLVVMKISGSKLRKVKVETGTLLTGIAEKKGFILRDSFIDEIGRRSLLTARNTYSDIITHDEILLWEKVAAVDEIAE